MLGVRDEATAIESGVIRLWLGVWVAQAGERYWANAQRLARGPVLHTFKFKPTRGGGTVFIASIRRNRRGVGISLTEIALWRGYISLGQGVKRIGVALGSPRARRALGLGSWGGGSRWPHHTPSHPIISPHKTTPKHFHKRLPCALLAPMLSRPHTSVQLTAHHVWRTVLATTGGARR